MTTQSIGPGGGLKLFSAQAGPVRDVKVLTFEGRADTGFIPNSQFRPDEPPLAILNVNDGTDATSNFGGVVVGGISQTQASDLTGQHFFALCRDTG